jgi:hypothetical protein
MTSPEPKSAATRTDIDGESDVWAIAHTIGMTLIDKLKNGVTAI